ncbi:hypothetical protein pb186bvf_020400 [Paramecium bursaria]
MICLILIFQNDNILRDKDYPLHLMMIGNKYRSPKQYKLIMIINNLDSSYSQSNFKDRLEKLFKPMKILSKQPIQKEGYSHFEGSQIIKPKTSYYKLAGFRVLIIVQNQNIS